MNDAAAKPALMDAWSRVALFLLFGYCLMGRSFAYLGVPPWHLFIGEIALAVFFLAGPITNFGPWVKFARRIRRLHRLNKVYSILLLYGSFEVVRGIVLGHPPLSALRDLAFDYYPLFFLLGLWVGIQKPTYIPRLFRLLAWFNAVYGVAFILFLNRVSWTFPGVSEQVGAVPIFGLPQFSFIILLGLLAYESDLWKIWHLLSLNAFVLLGMQIRSEWFGFAVGLLVWGLIARHFKRVIAASMIVVFVLGVMLAINFRVVGTKSRGGEISARDLVGRALAPVDPGLASEYTTFYREDLGSTVWRTVWWAAIWDAVNQNRRTALLGFGYGYAIGDLVPYLEGAFIQTPHDVFLYALSYTGWIGVLLFGLFQAELARLLWNACRRTGGTIGIVLWAAMLGYALFSPFFEAPQGAIPFYIILGLIAGTAMARFQPSQWIERPALRPSDPTAFGETVAVGTAEGNGPMP